jgi:gliding motility-associated-like protein
LNWATISGTDTTNISSTNTVNVSVAGTYWLIGTDPNNGCVNADSLVVTSNIVLPDVNAGADTALDCVSSPINLNGSGNAQGNPIGYNWTAINPTSPITNPNTASPIVSEVGGYVLTVQDLTTLCENSDTVFITLANALDISMVVTNPQCYGDRNGSIALGLPNMHPPYAITVNGENHASNALVSSLPAGQYDITVTDALGCEWNATQVLTQPQQSLIDLGLDLTMLLGDSTTVQAQTNLLPGAIDSVIWTPAELFNCNVPGGCLEQTISPLFSVAIAVTLVDTNGCKARDLLNIEVEDVRNVYVPNTFSPNDDGFNDVIFVNGDDRVQRINVFRIYDRWGEMVYEGLLGPPNDPTFGWDGTLRGKPLSPAVFVYYLEVEFVDGAVRAYKGDILLTR